VIGTAPLDVARRLLTELERSRYFGKPLG